MTLPPLQCPSDGSPLRLDGDVLIGNRYRYPVVFGVPVVVQGVQIESVAPPQDRLLEQLSLALGGAPSGRELQTVFSRRLRFEEDWLQTEADQFISRVADGHAGLAACVDRAGTPLARPTNVEPSLEVATDFRIGRIAAGETLTINVRVTNTGAHSVVSSDGDRPVRLSYLWKRDGQTIEGVRTALLVDLPPGQGISCPVLVIAPELTGTYELELCAVHENVRWLRSAGASQPVTVEPVRAERVRSLTCRTTDQFDYDEDHRQGVRLVEEWASRLVGRLPRVVELGGNANPMIKGMRAAERVNVDVDPYGMIVGSMRTSHSSNPVTYMVSDGMRLPLLDGWADVICLFATFHHFPRPAELLRHLATKLAPDGLLCLMCEPIGHVMRETIPPEYRRELLKGVNEQSFELWEYEQMFEAAGLEVAAHRIDVGSLKAALRRRR